MIAFFRMERVAPFLRCLLTLGLLAALSSVAVAQDWDVSFYKKAYEQLQKQPVMKVSTQLIRVEPRTNYLTDVYTWDGKLELRRPVQYRGDMRALMGKALENEGNTVVFYLVGDNYIVGVAYDDEVVFDENFTNQVMF